MYQAFMIGYVRRINEATLKVPYSGVRIGHAKYSRMAQINLRTGIITFSRYAIENVPERCRRYLVIHELTHVKEALHNKRFWNIVGRYVDQCRAVEMELQEAFQLNLRNQGVLNLPAETEVIRRLENPNLVRKGRSGNAFRDLEINPALFMTEISEENSDDCFDYAEDDYGSWTASPGGIITGGLDID